MTSLFRKFTWWLQRRRKDDELREELQFHLEEEAAEREADTLIWVEYVKPGEAKVEEALR